MLWLRLILLWLCGSALVVAMPGVGYACVYGTRFEVSEVHANGLVRLRWQCLNKVCSDKDFPMPLRVVDAATMADIPGEEVWSHGVGTSAVTIFWRPSDPLLEGRTYRVRDLSSRVEGKADFVVLPAIEWATTDELEVWARLDTADTKLGGDISCPARYPRQRCSPDEPPEPREVALQTLERTIMWVSAEVASPRRSSPPVKAKAVFWRKGDAPGDLESAAWGLYLGRQSFEEQAPHYCYRAAVQNLLDGTEREWEGCLEHGDLPALETRERDPELISQETIKCLEPPAGLETEWCKQSLMSCEQQGELPQNQCEPVRQRCSEQEPTDADAGAGASKPSRNGGCSVPHTSSKGSPRLLLLASLALLALRARRRAA
jgi:MYXO-CTERM domain-containing protein